MIAVIVGMILILRWAQAGTPPPGPHDPAHRGAKLVCMILAWEAETWSALAAWATLAVLVG